MMGWLHKKSVLFVRRSFRAGSKPFAKFLELGLTPSNSDKFLTQRALPLFPGTIESHSQKTFTASSGNMIFKNQFYKEIK